EGKDKKPETPPGPAAVTRPTTPKTPVDRKELDLRLGPDGRVQLNFHGQKWLDVLEWYAEIAGMSLDWQEVPGDFLNLRTQRSYTVDEIRDLLNRHLLDRGYTLLRHKEILIVVNLKKLDPALVPRVDPADLASREPHEFVKTSFKLDWLIAESTVEELKPMLSPHGKIWGFKATNRIEAIDAASNLLELERVLTSEQSGRGQERLVREFKLQHTRADDVYEMLLGLLGKEKPKKEGGAMDPRQMMQMQQMMQQMQQQGRPAGDAAGAKKAQEIHLVVNRKENSVLASGPPDQIALCEQAVKTLDVPQEQGSSLLANAQRMQIYRLMSVDPEPLVETLKEIGNLDPETQLRVDKKGKSIIAYAPLADHITIRAVVDKLDGTDRRFEVVKLRRLEADYVAGTIQFMMGEAEQKTPQRSSYYYNPFDYGGGGSSATDAETRKFRIEADVEHNRLLIWANDIEFGEIEKLLVKLGELPPAGARGSTFRTVDSIPLEDAPEVLERLRQTWPGLGGNPLQLNIKPKAEERRPETVAPPAKQPRDDATSTQIDPPVGQPALLRFTRASVSRTTDDDKAEAAETEKTSADTDDEADAASSNDAAIEAQPEKEPEVTQADPVPPKRMPPSGKPQRPPVSVELDANGRWILRSDDIEALDRLEDLIAELAPPRRDYKLFQLKHSTSWAFSIALTLEDFFKETEEKPKNSRMIFYDYGGSSQQSKKEAPRLSKRRQLKFIADTDSNSILVVGADPGQLKIIEELIEYYDQPVASDAKQIRRTQVFQIKYSQAKVIADAVKDVYRDLLSENDKALQPPPGQNGQNGQKEQKTERTVTYVYDNFGDDSSSGKKGDPPTPVRFKGALSIGVDEVSNSLVISSTEMMINDIKTMIETLDQAARPNVQTMQVLQVGRNVPAAIVQEKLAKMLKDRKPPPQQQPNGQPRQPNQPQQPQAEDGPFP
ncbi:MAG TPA: secretin N-terminal domain-containing protein, partial [Planctomycetaceae bacterium]|nr:secretin N-terminal domain-containing protein [Planctomycetaceae bacterium]